MINDNSQYHYDAYSVVNTTGSSQCVTIAVGASGCGVGSFGLASYAYLGSYDPNNLCVNYAGGFNSQIVTAGGYQVTVPAGQTLVVEVEEYVSGTGCGSYFLTISGLGSCATATPATTSTATSTRTPTTTATSTSTSSVTSTSTATATIPSNTATPTATLAANSPTPTATAISGCLLFNGSITTGDPTFQRPNTFTQGGSCSTSSTGAGVHYDVYELTTANATTILASLCAAGGGSANYDSFIAIYQAPGGAPQPGFVPNGCSLAVAANDDFCGSASQVQASVVAGTFYIVVTQYSTDTGLCTGGLCYGDYTLSVQGLAGCPLPTATPTNTPTNTRTATQTPTGIINTPTNTSSPTPSNTATATPCPPQGVGVFNGSITTLDPTFQRPNAFSQGGSCSTSSTGAGVHYDVYEFTTASVATVRASLCAAGGGSANFDSFIAIYQAPGGAPQPGFVPNGCSLAIAANDDFCGSASQVQANVAAGFYYVVVTQYSTSTSSCTGGLCYGDYSLSMSVLSCTPMPTFTPPARGMATATPTRVAGKK